MKRMIPLVFAMMTAAPVAAHPHIFVDTGLEMIFDAGGQLTHLRVTWRYDALFSLMITEDMGLDPDYDGVLTPAENKQLTGFDMNWDAGYPGDTELLSNGAVVPLSRPTMGTASFSEGQITSTHLRAVLEPVKGTDDIVIKPYDPTYYTAYDVTLPIIITGTDACRARVKMPVMGEALMALREELSTLGADALPEDEGLPNIGAELSNDVIVTCAGS